MKRVDMHSLQELVRLHRLGKGPREVARLLGISPNTERRYRLAIEKHGLLAGEADAVPEMAALKAVVLEEMPVKDGPQQVSKIASCRPAIEEMLLHGAEPTAIYDRLRLEEKDFHGSLSAVKRLCRRIQREHGVSPDDVAIPVDTDPGEVAQVDFGYVGKLLDPVAQRLRKAWVFVMVLGYSRHQFSRIVFDQKVETWIELHVAAFKALGGVVRVVVPDNLKSAVVRAAFGIDEQSVLNRSYRELARHYGFMVDPAPIRSPEKKGKVESGVKYVKNNFFKPRRDELDAGVLQQQLDQWVREIAGMRRHGTTHRRPIEVFEQVERAALKPLPATAYEVVVWREPSVHQDCHVLIGNAMYSVPWRLVGQKVLAQVTRSSVLLFHDDVRVATHARIAYGRQTVEEHLPPGRRELRHRSRTYWEERAETIGPEVGAYVRAYFDSDDVLSQLRGVQAVVTHLEGYPQQRARAACARASHFASYSYRAIKNILSKALDQQPLPGAVPTVPALANPRFARDIRELYQLPLEYNHAPN